MHRNSLKNSSGFSRLLLCGSALTGALISAAPALADDTSANGIEIVTVTARARAEDIHSVPAQITAFTAADIAAKGIEKPQDFLSAVPNVTFVETQNAGTSFLVMRGISQARNSEPSAAIVVDGVPMTQPAQFNQEMLDIQQIEVLKGPQGALYGRDAIGGAIIITTKQPGDEWESHFTAGYESGPGYKLEGETGGPVTDTLKIRAAASYFDTDGHLTNADTTDSSAKRNVDPVKDFNARVSALWTPNSNFTADLRLSTDLLTTRALYYIIPPFGSPHFNDPNYTSQPINLNNSGENARKIYDAALKLSYDMDGGTLSSITGYNTVWEILTGDGYTFDPFDPTAGTPACTGTINKICFNFDQSQFLDVKTFTQEVRYTSSADRRFRYIFGGEIFDTSRYISTGNMFDAADEGVKPIYRMPNPQFGISSFGPQSQVSYLADSQKQFAWAIYLDTSFDITQDLELSLNVRYDRDHRQNTTDTPQEFLDANPITGRAAIPAHTGDKRAHTWDDVQPQAVLKYKATDNLNVYASFSRGFRSGGFNQTGVATAAVAGGYFNVSDIFDQETANTWEAGFKSRWLDDKLVVNGSVYTTRDNGAYYFVFLASNSTQNLGNIKEVQYQGFDLDATAKLSDDLTLNAGFGYTDSEVKKFPLPTPTPIAADGNPLQVVGSNAPLVSDYTADVGVQWVHPVWNDWNALVRLDYNAIGPTTFVIPVLSEPMPVQRDTVNLVDLRAGFQDDTWSLMFWSKNLLNEKYNTEYSTGGFLFKAQPMRWGVDLSAKF